MYNVYKQKLCQPILNVFLKFKVENNSKQKTSKINKFEIFKALYFAQKRLKFF